jgi:hypothetical protein
MVFKRLVTLYLSLVLTLIFRVAYSEENVTLSNAFIVPDEAQNKIIGVRISDLVNSFPNLVPGMANVSQILKTSPESFFNQTDIEIVHTVFMNKLPEVSGDTVKLSLTGLVKYKKDGLVYEKISVTYAGKAKSLIDLSIEKESSLLVNEMSFRISVGLVDRKLIINDSSNDVKIVFPIGVGAFDEGVMNEGIYSLVTPRFNNGFIDRREVISKREKPRYFAGKPFIRISKGNDLRTDSTAIGFHIEINDSFVRGFDSHGCMRLREMDLMAFHDIIMFGSLVKTPITVRYRTEDPADHPAKKKNQTYKTILNKGSSSNPFFIYDRDNLVQLVYKDKKEAPLEKLVDLEQDNYYDLFSYDTLEQMRDQDQRRKNECDAKMMSGELLTNKNYQECLDEGKRQGSFKDKIYRKWMGINSVVPTPES